MKSMVESSEKPKYLSRLIPTIISIRHPERRNKMRKTIALIIIGCFLSGSLAAGPRSQGPTSSRRSVMIRPLADTQKQLEK
ncbi:MAG: hypothetical protein M3362_12495, partial [Acidobacteriota bacterium]|nr:hypothetical protein [Acidobacteriota bacterium]